MSEAVLDQFMHMARMIREGTWLPRYRGADSIAGVPVTVSEHCAREVIYSVPVMRDGLSRLAIVMHPFTAQVLAGAIVTGRRMGDLGLQLDAIVPYIAHRAAARAADAEARLDQMVADAETRQEERLRLWLCPAGYALRHHWVRESYMRLTCSCTVCGELATDEALARAGVPIGRA